MPESEEPGRLTSDPVNRAPEGEGVRAGPATQKGEPIQQSVFDSGEEIVVVTAENEQGRKQGTGETAADAMADVQDTSEPIGKDFGTADAGGH